MANKYSIGLNNLIEKLCLIEYDGEYKQQLSDLIILLESLEPFILSVIDDRSRLFTEMQKQFRQIRLDDINFDFVYNLIKLISHSRELLIKNYKEGENVSN